MGDTSTNDTGFSPSNRGNSQTIKEEGLLEEGALKKKISLLRFGPREEF